MRNIADKEMLSEFMDIKYALLELKRTGECIPLSEEAEDEAQEILKKMKKISLKELTTPFKGYLSNSLSGQNLYDKLLKWHHDGLITKFENNVVRKEVGELFLWLDMFYLAGPDKFESELKQYVKNILRKICTSK